LSARHYPKCSFAGKQVQFAALDQGRQRTQGKQIDMKTVVQIPAVTAILIAGAVAVADATGQSLQELDRSLLFPSNADIAAGMTLATDACGSCHSLDGGSIDPTLPHLAGQHVIYLYNELNAYKQGDRDDESMSKAVEFLSDDAFRKVSIYYASLAPPEPAAPAGTSDDSQSAPNDPVQLGEAAAAGCAGCHGADGNSLIPGMPNLTAQSPEYFGVAMSAYQSGGRQGSMMNALVSAIDEETIRNMGLYYAVQEARRTAAGGSGDVEAGRAAAQACSTCHGADGNITAADMPTLAGQDALYLANSMKAYAQGQRDHAQMVAATAELSDAEIDIMASFYAEQEPIARRVNRPPTLADWIERCDRCHGVGGNSHNPRYPSLASQNEAYLARVIDNYASGGRHNTTMSAMSQPLRESDIDGLAAYYASQARKSILYVELPCAAGTDQ
jgi:cytochrome c553